MNKIKKRLIKILVSTKAEILILVIILLASFSVRLYKIDNPVADWHAWRQADTVSVSRIYSEQGINLLKPRYYDISAIQTGYSNPEGLRFVEFPIYNLFNVYAYKTFPSLSIEKWGRLISVFSAVTSTFFLYLIGKNFINKWGGLLAAGIYSFIPYNIYFTRVILPEPMTVMFTLASLWFFVLYTKKEKSRHIFLSSVLFASALLLKPFVIFYFPIYLYLLIKKFGWKVFSHNVVIYIALVVTLVPFFLWRGWINSGTNFIGVPQFEWLYKGNGIRFRPAWWRWIFGERLGNLILGIWGLPLVVFGFLRKNNWPILMMGLGMFLYVVIVSDGNVQHDYYQIITIPTISLFLASGIFHLWNTQEFKKIFSRGIVLFCVVMMLGIGWYQIKGNYQINHYEVIAAGQEANRILPKDALVIAPYNGDTTFLYFIHRFGWPVVDRSFDELISMGADYFVSVNYDNDTNFLLTKYKTIEKNDSFVIIDLHQPI